MPSQAKDYLLPSRTALIVWDVQEALVGSIFNKEDFLTKISELVDAARINSISVFYTKIVRLPEKFESKARLAMWKEGKGRGNRFEPGDIAREIYPKDGDVVLDKYTGSIFVGTSFEYMARNAALSSLIFTGIATNMGVESSARHALNLGFLPVIASNKEILNVWG